MIEILGRCRQGELEKDLKVEIRNTILIILLGTALGVLSKLLDNMPLISAIGWHRIFGCLDLRNVFTRQAVWGLFAVIIAIYSKRPLRASINIFGFFLGMLIGYYTITITVSGFFPRAYMLAWGLLTLFTPVLAFFTWYAKGHGWIATVLSSIIIAFFFTQAFCFGKWYIDISHYDGVICLVLAIILLYRDIRKLVFSLLGVLITAPIIKILLPYIFGGL